MYFTNLYVSILNIFTNGVEATLDVPGLLVKPGLLGKCNSSSVVIPSASGPMKIFCDNTGAIALAKESRFHKKTKHIRRCFNSIRDLVQVGDIEICKILTDLNVTDPLTKIISQAKHNHTLVLFGC